MNIHLQDVHVTLVISPTDLRCGYRRLHSIVQDLLGIDLNGGKEAVVFISKTRRICKIITSDNRRTLLLTRLSVEDSVLATRRFTSETLTLRFVSFWMSRTTSIPVSSCSFAVLTYRGQSICIFCLLF